MNKTRVVWDVLKFYSNRNLPQSKIDNLMDLVIDKYIEVIIKNS